MGAKRQSRWEAVPCRRKLKSMEAHNGGFGARRVSSERSGYDHNQHPCREFARYS